MLTRTGETIRPIILAHVAPFRLGGVDVQPATRQLVRDGVHQTIEPRVMQVLVALAQAHGGVVTRDELTDLCWDGRIVSESAIDRVISRLRQIAAGFAAGSFEIETITKVGYRIVPTAASETKPEPVPVPEQPRADAAGPTRRRAIFGGLAAAGLAAGGGLFFWTRAQRHQPHPVAVELCRRGQIAQRQGVPEQVRQAVSFFKQATELDPLYAEAWGGLALSYRHILEGFGTAELGGLPSLIESAARRALALDPTNADAKIALVIIKPYYRNWGPMEADLIPLGERYPDHWFVQAQLGIIRYEVGRWRDGLRHTERQLEVEPFIPIPHFSHARALWSMGRLQEAEAVLDAAIKRWPAHPAFWHLKFAFLLYNGRPASAAAFVMNPETQPEGLGPEAIQERILLARAVERQAPADLEASLAASRRQMLGSVESIIAVAPVFLLLGRPDLALQGLDRYYFGDAAADPPIPPPGPFTRRYTAFLFMPNMAPLWREPRFGALLGRIGLERYWRQSGTRPDFRG